MKEQLEKFIQENNLTFEEGVRNTNLVVLCGYGLFIEADSDDLWYAIPDEERTEGLLNILETVLEYASNNNYGEWWKTEEAKKLWKF